MVRRGRKGKDAAAGAGGTGGRGGGAGRGGGRGGSGGGGGGGGVREATLVRVSKVLEDFQASDAQVYKFEPGISKQERAAIHEMCRKMGMISKSSGNGERRCLSVYKRKQNQGLETEEGPSHLGFSVEARNVLQDLFMHYPPDDAELNGHTVRNSSDKAVKIQWKPDGAFCRPALRKPDILKKVEMLASKVNKSEQLRKIVQDRSKLPISSYKDAISSTLENHQVVLISGETGCGKTTQVPQYILDHMWGKGESCKIVCTQPRRISAISVAERISAERGESVGDTVGYKIRLESKGGKNSSIMFCTNGVLLRLLIGRVTNISKEQNQKRSFDDAVTGITHIIVDEIHERDRFSDFMLAILRDLLPLYPHLRLVLMSATIDAERFSNYFSGCPFIQVPGFTHPVKTFYLEDVLSILQSVGDNHLDPTTDDLKQSSLLTDDYKSSMDEAINLALDNDEFDPLLELISAEQNQEIFNYQHSETGVTPLMVLAGKGQVGDICMLLSFGVDCSTRDHDGKSALGWAEQGNQQEVCEVIKKHMECGSAKLTEENELLNKYLATINPEHIDTVLIERLLRKICVDSNEGAILVFLPGWEDINQTRERLLASPFFQDSSKFLVLSLHSMIPSSEQKKVFKRPPAGSRKIILSTNIAETAVTIDDVVFVIDSGRMKEKSYDPYNNVSTLHSSWVSKANARQRQGRAGRCQPGTCYHLYSRFRAASLLEYQIPEIKRMPIEELCLQVKLLDPNCRIADFLRKTLDPPIPETVRNAITVLQDLGALTQDEQLTELGEKLGSLPVHPSTSKMLLFGILMNCLDPALTLACAADYRDPFLLPMAPDERKRAAAAKVELASLYGGYSDQLAVVAAMDCWRRAKDRGQEAQFCSKYFVSSNTMNMLSNMRKQLQNELAQRGFVPVDASACSLNARDPGIIRAVLMAGAYPMVGRLLPPRKNTRRAVIETASGAKVRLHPHSCNFNLSFRKTSGNPLVIYDEITRGDGGMYIKNSSVVGSYPLIILATEMVVAPPEDDDSDEEDGDSSEDETEKVTLGQHKEIMSSPDNSVSVVIDRWLRFDATALDVAQIYCLRERLASAILFKVKHPQDVLPPDLGATMYAIACILSYDGLPAMITSDDVATSQGSNQSSAESSRFSQGRRVGYIPPGGFLMSLLSDKPLNAPHFQKSFNHPDGASGHIRSSRTSVGRFDQSRHPQRNNSGPGSSAARTFKRQRNGAQ
ncbi:putative DEIH-box RNA/DNA helicase [Oryza sativa Japonica Group]|uniref:DEIH-box RNA/DNA helicase n=4 Tax=Oryza sativa subsp. japonica TaxID=39947 RepID=Q0JJ02_ORYSJ|nr:putative DEIH-box RNA/DNA helicase [Oryza sativa Japonica Group]BAD53353.1 putative DEIH-box RNA/DNA helicase [Oryza sativa Japonica Group]BAF06276.1 Os01g0767700 [Oryza sativa Japonica Group]BAS74522.1 Os01g0767700 [Oryza sativa Japonica Group]|eukprot:NP_001044362.1 Os01g0767700 [Oryza sativa Japonica Group]